MLPAGAAFRSPGFSRSEPLGRVTAVPYLFALQSYPFCLHYSSLFVCSTVPSLFALQYPRCLRYSTLFVCTTVPYFFALQYPICLQSEVFFVPFDVAICTAVGPFATLCKKTYLRSSFERGTKPLARWTLTGFGSGDGGRSRAVPPISSQHCSHINSSPH